jgi:type I restriction enzyme M protein
MLAKYKKLMAKETKLKADIKKALSELEIKVINQYPKLSVEEIKTLVVDKKWMASIETKIKTEMDAISHRLTERIKELAERYETPLPKLTNDVADLTKKVEEHLKKMGYTF